MSLVYSETAVKKKPFFSSGEPEPRLQEGELFIYVSQSGEYIVVPYEKTPVSNAFINKNKINYRIKMHAGPFEYSLDREFYTCDHRKQLKVEIYLKLDILDAIKLYNARIDKVEDQLNRFVPSYIASLVSSYEIEDIIQLQNRLSDIHVFPGLINELTTLGLRVVSYNAIVDKDLMQQALDKEARKKEFEREQEVEDAKHEAKIKHGKQSADTMYGSQAKFELITFYNDLLEKHGNPTFILSTIPNEEDRSFIRNHWKDTGVLLEAPKAPVKDNGIEDLLKEID